MHNRIEGVATILFDVGNTLTWVDLPRAARLLTDEGRPCPPEALAPAEAEARRVMYGLPRSLTDGERLGNRFRDQDAAQRIADWRRLCANAGIPTNWAIAFEAADPGPRDNDRLARLLGVETP